MIQRNECSFFPEFKNQILYFNDVLTNFKKILYQKNSSIPLHFICKLHFKL